MTGLRVLCCALSLLTVLLLAKAPGFAQERQKLTVEGIREFLEGRDLVTVPRSACVTK